MKLEHQVNTAKQGYLFDALGLKLDSYFVWSSKACSGSLFVAPRGSCALVHTVMYPAYSCAELLYLKDQAQHFYNHGKVDIFRHDKYLEAVLRLDLERLPAAHREADILILGLEYGVFKSGDLTL